MKSFKRIAAIILAVALVATTLSLTAFADTTPTAKLTVDNAAKGQTYTIYRIFDAAPASATDESGSTTVDYTAISYTTTNKALADMIKAHQNDEIPATPGATPVCPYEVLSEANGVYTIVHRAADDKRQGAGWLNTTEVRATWENTAAKYVATCGGKKQGESAEATVTNSTVVFDVPLGYYYMDTTNGNKNPSVVTLVKDEKIEDKNPIAPGTPTKTEDQTTVVVGETVNYKTGFTAVNYLVSGDKTSTSSNMVREYKLTDTYSEGLTFTAASSIKSIKLYALDQLEDGKPKTGATSFKTLAVNTDYTMSTDTGKFVLTIPWAKDNNAGQQDKAADWENLYDSPCYIEVEYSMVVNDKILANLKESNKIVMSYTHDAATITPTNQPPEVYVYSTAISIAKRDATQTNMKLPGAEFVLYKLDTDGKTPLYYHLKADNTIEWVKQRDDDKTKTDDVFADHKIADNKFETKEFQGLEAGTYYLLEVKAPDGYNPTGVADEITIAFEDGELSVTMPSIDDGGSGNTIAINDYEYYTATVYNSKAGRMPGTGGAGTVALVSIGAVLFLGAAVLLVTKKRMYNAD